MERHESMHSIITIDIETIPRQDITPSADLVKIPATYKKEDSIQKYVEENMDTAYRKLAVDPFGAQIIVISAAFKDEKPVVTASDNEEKVMKEIDNWLGSLPTKTPLYAIDVCGFNIAEFDLPMLFLRACKYGCRNIIELLPGKPYDDRICDVMRMAFPTKRNEYVSMDKLCGWFGIEGKGDMDGSMVYDYFLEGRLHDIALYCQSDVEKTRELYNKLK